MFVTRIDTCFLSLWTLISETSSSQFCQLPVTTSGKKKEENWSEQFLLKVYIVVCYFSLIIFSTVELTSLAAFFMYRELCSLIVIYMLLLEKIVL